MKVFNGEICRTNDGRIVLDDDGSVVCQCDDGSMFAISLDIINWDADTLQYQNGDDIYLISTKTTSTMKTSSTSSTTTIEMENDDLNNDVVSEKGEKRKKNPYVWSNSATKLLLELYQIYQPMVSERKIKTFKKMWEKITMELQGKGYGIDVDQVENRFKTLKRNYVDSRHHNKQTGNGRKICAYEDELQSILGKRHNINPTVISDNTGVHVLKTDNFDRDISNVPEKKELNNFQSVSSFPCPSTSSESSSKRQKTVTTASGLQICNQTMEELKTAILTRHTERSDFEKKILAKYCDESEKAETFRQNLLKMKQEKLDIMKSFLNK